jgi:hypothetical protein
MGSNRIFGARRVLGGFGALALAAGLTVATAAAQSNAPGERFEATAMDINRAIATPVEIVIDRWSSDAERDRLMKTLLDRGADKLLEDLQRAEKVGYIKVPGSLSWDLHFARKVELPDGGERVVIATDRPISFAEQVNQPRTIDYPFTLIDMRLNAEGEGSGMLSIATKIIPDKEGNLVTLENYGTQPVRLSEVKVIKRS